MGLGIRPWIRSRSVRGYFACNRSYRVHFLGHCAHRADRRWCAGPGAHTKVCVLFRAVVVTGSAVIVAVAAAVSVAGAGFRTIRNELGSRAIAEPIPEGSGCAWLATGVWPWRARFCSTNVKRGVDATFASGAICSSAWRQPSFFIEMIHSLQSITYFGDLHIRRLEDIFSCVLYC